MSSNATTILQEANVTVSDLARQAILKLSLNEFQALTTIFRTPKEEEARRVKAIFDSVHVKSTVKVEEVIQGEADILAREFERRERINVVGENNTLALPSEYSPTTASGGRSNYDADVRKQNGGWFKKTACSPGHHKPTRICSHTIGEHLRSKACPGNRCRSCKIVVCNEQYSSGCEAFCSAIGLDGNFTLPTGKELATALGRQHHAPSYVREGDRGERSGCDTAKTIDTTSRVCESGEGESLLGGQGTNIPEQ